jgi:hypothetical protein
MKNSIKIGLLTLTALVVGLVFMASNPYNTNSVGQGRYFNYPPSATGQDTLTNADTIIYDVPFKVTDLNRYEFKLHAYAARLTGTETINVYIQEQVFLENSLSHWINTDTIAMGALGAGGVYNAIYTKELAGTRIRLNIIASGTTSSAAIKWQGVLRRKDGAES